MPLTHLKTLPARNWVGAACALALLLASLIDLGFEIAKLAAGRPGDAPPAAVAMPSPAEFAAE
jgi:hypothetical protein